MERVADLLLPLHDMATSLALAMPRSLVCLMLVPAFSSRFLHGMLRTAIAVAISLPVAVAIYYQQAMVDIGPWLLIGLLLKECALGVLLGLILALPFWLFESIGALFDTQRGAAMGEQLNPETGSMTSIVGMLLQQSAVILLIQMGAFMWLFGLMVDSYLLWPAPLWLPDTTPESTGLLVAEFARMVQQFVLYALPLIATLLVIELLFALVGVYAPQLPVYFVAMPVKSLVGLGVLALYAALLWKHGLFEFQRWQEGSDLLRRILPPPLMGTP